MPKPARAPLSELENKVMRIVWLEGQATAERVREALADRDDLKDSTVRTILRRLEEKGYVTHRTEGRAYVYRPAVAQRSVAAEAVRSIIQRLCNGSVEDLLLGMIDREVVSPDALQQLAQRVTAAQKTSPEQRRTAANKKQRKG